MKLYENKNRKGTPEEKILTLTLPKYNTTESIQGLSSEEDGNLTPPKDKVIIPTVSITKKSINKSINYVLNLPIFKKFNIDGNSALKIFFEEPILLGDKLFFVEVVCNCNPLASGNYLEAFNNSRNNIFNKKLNLELSSFKTSNINLPFKLNFLTNYLSNYTNIITIHSPSFTLYGDTTFEDLEKTIKDKIKKVYEENYQKGEVDLTVEEKSQTNNPPFSKLFKGMVKFKNNNIYLKFCDKFLKLNVINDNSLKLNEETEIKIDDKEINLKINLGDDDAFSQKDLLIIFYDEVIKRFNEKIPSLMKPKLDLIIKTFFKIIRNPNVKNIPGTTWSKDLNEISKVKDIRQNRLDKILNDFTLVYEGKEIKKISEILNLKKFEQDNLKIIEKDNKEYQIQTYNPFKQSFKDAYSNIMEDIEIEEKSARIDHSTNSIESADGEVRGLNSPHANVKNSLLLPPFFLFEHPIFLKLLLEHELTHFVWFGEQCDNIVEIKDIDNNNYISKPKNINGDFFINLQDKHHSSYFYQSIISAFKEPISLFWEPLNYILFTDNGENNEKEFLDFNKERLDYNKTSRKDQEKGTEILKKVSKKYYNIDLDKRNYLKDFSLNDSSSFKKTIKVKKSKER